MALQFILGGSASGKSYNAYSKIISEAAKDRNASFFVIVPEQFTMQTQRDLVMMSEKKGISNIDVLSFMRLAYRVFEEVGEPDRLTLEDTGKNMVIRKLLNEKKDDLVYYGRARGKQGFTEELKSLITELYQYCVSPEALDKVTEGLEGHPLLRNKLKDVNLIYKSFGEFKKDKYITAEEVLDLLCICLERSKSLKNSVILFYGFTGFTPSQVKVLRILLGMAKDVLVTVTIDPEVNPSNTGEFDLFALSAKTIRTLLKVADEEGVTVAKDFYTDHKHENPEIAALERNIFRYPYEKYDKEIN
ncbi:MAG: helicase-exonuclease AddAB subunit AddB, partial [Lachnospiraceae bacterium]|nr:helicase-exonuclease AddAB subunit AddB [Lachnospiraceae bacterium]